MSCHPKPMSGKAKESPNIQHLFMFNVFIIRGKARGKENMYQWVSV
jgi:hypothetical protein